MQCVPLTKVIGRSVRWRRLPFLCRIKRSHFPGKCHPFMRNNWPLREGIVTRIGKRRREERGRGTLLPSSIDATPQSVNLFCRRRIFAEMRHKSRTPDFNLGKVSSRGLYALSNNGHRWRPREFPTFLQRQYVQRSAKVFFLGCVTRLWAQEESHAI